MDAFVPVLTCLLNSSIGGMREGDIQLRGRHQHTRDRRPATNQQEPRRARRHQLQNGERR